MVNGKLTNLVKSTSKPILTQVGTPAAEIITDMDTDELPVTELFDGNY